MPLESKKRSASFNSLFKNTKVALGTPLAAQKQMVQDVTGKAKLSKS
jgi:hypothetical protein